MLFPFSVFHPPAIKDHTTLTYSSDGDANGVFYYIGALGGSWVNPSTSGEIVIAASNLAAGSLNDIVDRGISEIFSNPQANNWFSFDLKAGRALVCNKASFRGRPAGGHCAAITLQGSGNGVVWTDLSVQTTIDEGASAWTSFDVSTTAMYRYFRIVHPTNDYFCIGEFELYGQLIS